MISSEKAQGLLNIETSSLLRSRERNKEGASRAQGRAPLDLNLQRIEPERSHDDILIGTLSNPSVVAEGVAASHGILQTDLHLAPRTLIDTLPYTARNLPNV